MTAEGSFLICPANGHDWRATEVGDFAWFAKHLSQTLVDEDGYVQRFTDVTCEPTNVNKQTLLWKCLAKMTFFRVGGRIVMDQMTSVHLFNSKNPTFHFMTYLKGTKGGSYYSRVRIDIVESYCVDLSDPENSLIEDSDNSAHFKVDGVEMYLSKRMLGAHSHFFYAMFTRDFKEKAEDFYELKDIRLDGFLLFLEIVHSLNLSVDKSSYRSLTYIGAFFQCKLVLHLCEDFLLKDENIPLMDKIYVATRFRLNGVLLANIPEVTDKLWKKIRGKKWLSDFARDSFKEMMNFS